MTLMNHWKTLRNICNEPATRHSRVSLVHHGQPNLSADARALIEDDANRKFISVASLWEIAIKSSIGKLTLSAPFDKLIPQQLSVNGFELLPIELAHLAAVTTLPFHHRDPFDRLLIAQATVEKMPIVTIDSAFEAYSVTRL